ncbi:MAG: formyl transferase [Halioglobus sp.]
MKILLLCNSDLASNYALNLLLPRLQEHQLKLLLSSSVGGSNKRDPLLGRLKFFEQELFNQLVFPLLDRGEGPGMMGFDGLSSFLAESVSIENAINSPEALARIADFGPELIISIRYGGILKDTIIGLPDKGVINLHSGRLPEYRGVMATFWAMLAGDSELGTTLHTIDDGSIDTGRVIATTRRPLDREKSYLGNVLSLYPAAVDNIVDAVAQLSLGEVLQCERQKQDGNYYSFPSNEDFKQFSNMGYELFNSQEILSFASEHYLGSA